MSTTRHGKIARLAREVREQLNIKLDDGMKEGPLLAWLNELAATKRVVEEQFGGKAISAQNLSQWRRGGYQDWLRGRQVLELAERMGEEGQDLEAAMEGPKLNERLGRVLSLELAGRLRQWQRETGEPQERWRQLRELLREFAALRREEQRAAQAKLAREKWERRGKCEERRAGMTNDECLMTKEIQNPKTDASQAGWEGLCEEGEGRGHGQSNSIKVDQSENDGKRGVQSPKPKAQGPKSGRLQKNGRQPRKRLGFRTARLTSYTTVTSSPMESG